ncbi:MAG: calcium-translocating P-type ATPase, PMCA-type [Clostridia bacterium]|nr:calcium-translocating P-type ATPase, PMCA-type [Clostridia bacterium]
MKEYLKTSQEVLEKLNTNQNGGLSESEAKSRLEKNGPNKLKEGKKDSLIKKFFAQLADPMIIILICAAAVSAFTAVYSNESPADTIIILAVVLINAVLGVFQESKAEKAIEALQAMTAAQSKVVRDGKLMHVKSEELVVGDIIILEAGDDVPADARILESASLKVEEAALTGESVPVEKHSDVLSGEVSLGDRKNMVYMGSAVVYGRCVAVITAVGMETEMGKIADALAQAEDGQTPLQIKLAQLSKILTWLVLGICVVVFVIDLLRIETLNLVSVMETFMIAVSLAVAAIPEGLAAVVTIVLSIGVTNMSKRRAVIRKLTAVETLGCAQVICSDKTGTLTQNKMTVVEHYASDEKLLATAMALCSDAVLDENNVAMGEPTEAALVQYAFTLDLKKGDLEATAPRISEAPFDSMRKMMSTVHNAKGSIVQYTKGAPDELLKKCKFILTENGVEELTDEKRAQVLDKNKEFADSALRVLGAAYKNYEAAPENTAPEQIENELIFIGLVGMIDPVRPEVKDAIDICRAAGITPVMITGDHKDTAVAIALQLGIIKDKAEALTGADIDKISDEEFEQTIEKYHVYARVQPEHKVRIVKAWRAKGCITAMTGDGVNDAPSIKNADIGVGMGITGTDVTKNVADMVLADDNFATIVSAVEEGRRIYDNIRKAMQFLLSANLAEVITIFTATLIGFEILGPVHLLWINLVTDTFPAVALGMEQAEDNVMQREPRSAREGVFAGGMGFDILFQGVIVSAITLAAYFVGANLGGAEHGMTMAFVALSMTEIFHAFNMRSRRASVLQVKGHNKVLWLSMLMSLVLTVIILFVQPIAQVFGFTQITVPEFLIAVGIAFVIIPVVEITKFVQRKINK